ncbi:MAG: WD40 repeat domain-containing protein [Chloroflexi bacterium]|nr:WD40 repeat domain-containing protein [Chloroflexota bacterium]
MKLLQKIVICLIIAVSLRIDTTPTHSYLQSSPTTLGHGSISSLDRHPKDGTLLVAGSLGLWHYAEDFEVLGHYDQVLDISVAKWSNDGDKIAVRQRNGNLYVFDVEQQEYIQLFEETDSETSYFLVAWSPDEQFLAVNIDDGKDRIVIIDIESQMAVSELVLASSITDLFWSDENTVLYKNFASDFETWNFISQEITELNTGLTYFEPYSFKSQNSKLATITTENVIDIWDTKTARKEMTIATEIPVVEIDWNTSGNQLALLTGDSKIVIWDIASEKSSKSTDIPDLPPLQSFTWDADNNLVYTVDWSAGIRAWNLDENRQEHYFQKHSTYGDFIAWQPGGNLIAIDQNAEQFKWIKLWNVDTGDVEYMLPVSNANMISNLAWSETGDMLMASFHSDRGDSTPEVFVWTMGDNGPSLDYTYHSDSRFTIAVPGTPIMPILNYEAIGDNEIVLWDMVEDTEQLTIDDADDEDILLLHENRLAVIDEAHVSIWDLEKLELISRRDLPEEVDVYGLPEASWNTDGGLFAGGICYQFGPCPVWVWDYETSEIVFELDEYFRGSPVYSFLNGVAWSPNGTMLATAGGEETNVMVWTPEGVLITAFTDFGDWVMAIGWSNDSSTIAAATLDGTIYLLEVQ